MKKIAVAIVIILLILIVGFFVLKKFVLDKKGKNSQNEIQTTEIPPLEVKGAIADIGEVTQWVETLGRVDATKRVDFISPSNTIIERLYVRQGDSVRQGQQLAQLRYSSELASYEQAMFDLEKARTRYQYGLEIGDTNRNLLRVSSGLLDAERQYASIARTVQDLNIRAPFSGVVTNILREAGSSVRQGELVLSVISGGGLIVRSYVPQTELWGLGIGNGAIVSSVEGDRRSEGTVISVSPVVDEQGTGEAVVSLDGQWRVGEIVSVEIQSEVYPERLRVPYDAVLNRQNKFLVFVVREGKAKWQWVTTGERGRDYIEIIEGIQEGDTVLVEGQFTIAHDTKVKVLFE
ncbi:efflux RND transporter periplasmic adaptor subunit [candidate division WOR-3 bacterium]|nr:efflux RND transporter periplasmic adaptor subunit [candidate division WOR-3 bacterium]